MRKHSRSPFNKNPSSNRARHIRVCMCMCVYSKIILHRIGAIYPVKNDGEPVCKRAKRKRAWTSNKKKKRAKKNNSPGARGTSDGIRRRL